MTIYFRNLRLETNEQVYEPAEDSFLLAENLDANPGDAVLDVGTGTGIIALAAAEKAGNVMGVDVNAEAVKLAKINASLNGIANVDFRVSDLFANVSGAFDLITFNPPYLPTEEEGSVEQAWAGGEGGREVIGSFIESAGVFLKPGGRIQLLASSLNKLDDVLGLFRKRGFDAEVTANEKFFFEELYVLTAGRR